MARCFCRWRNVLICVCTPCILMLLMILYVTIVVCMNMNQTTSVVGTGERLVNSHFVAPGTFRNESFGPRPKTFWRMNWRGNGLWNHLQQIIDQRFNPVLNSKTKFMRKFENSHLPGFLLRKSYGVVDLDSIRKNFHELPQQMQDFVDNMQKRNYSTLIQPDGVCGAGAKDEKEPPLLLLAIKTTALNLKNRQVIRKTWGRAGWVEGQTNGTKTGGYVRRLFLLGKEDADDPIAGFPELLEMESQSYGDILQWDFRDTFFNLTLKDVLFWSWFSRVCNQTHFVFKGDDDVFVNTPRIVTYLRDQLQKPEAQKTLKDFMIGDVIDAAEPSRSNKTKYFVPNSFYLGLYPTYAGGGGVIYSGLLTRRLHKVSKGVHLFPIDDVYVGMCMARLYAVPIHNPAFLTFNFKKKEEEQELCAYHRILLVHKRSPEEILKLWAHLKEVKTQCQGVPLRTVDKKEEKKP